MSSMPVNRQRKEQTIMKLFTIDSENNITLYASATKAPTGEEIHRFSSEKDLAKL